MSTSILVKISSKNGNLKSINILSSLEEATRFMSTNGFFSKDGIFVDLQGNTAGIATCEKLIDTCNKPIRRTRSYMEVMIKGE